MVTTRKADLESVLDEVQFVVDSLEINLRTISPSAVEEFLANCMRHNTVFDKTETRPGVIGIGAIFARRLREELDASVPVSQVTFVGVAIQSVIEAEKKSHSKHDGISFLGDVPHVMEQSLPAEDESGEIDREIFADDITQMFIELGLL